MSSETNPNKEDFEALKRKMDVVEARLKAVESELGELKAYIQSEDWTSLVGKNGNSNLKPKLSTESGEKIRGVFEKFARQAGKDLTLSPKRDE